MSEPGFRHVPVLLGETLAALAPRPGGDYLDGTAGGGGHSEAILLAMEGRGTLTLMDRDPQALRASRERLSAHPNVSFIHGNFHDARELLEGRLFDGILLDLGVSSPQLDTPERGFSYHEDAPLDMRMDQSAGMTAADWLNGTPEREITQALYDYADERWAARIAKTIAAMRAQKPFETTRDLVDAVDRAIPKAVRRKDEGHPARRTFQAVRIAVNEEIAPLPRALEDLVMMLRPGGRLCVISFHSIEDRAVKHTLRRLKDPCVCPPDAPVCVCGKQPLVSLPKGYPAAPTEEELAANPRSRSALLRVAQRLP
ncbi:MAG TPA: 16S rRNA (cytosine(1402)-N(4))-methyltransferase RsmH [Candidatus Limnocylindria bacterium]|nr:16S rRNA (cytosine(1402)-N(4))-methyltransferase RsmH [Candidatus Limnocylindria bacterium]